MEKSAIKKSIRRLREARGRIPALRVLQVSFATAEFDQAWFELLGTINSIPEILKTGGKSHPRSRQWFAGQERTIRKDPLLRYLLHSRGGDFHGQERVMELRVSPGSFTYEDYGLDENPPINAGKLDVPITVNQIKVWYQPQVVSDQHGNKFIPPQTHMGFQIFDKSPAGLAELALEFYEKLIRDAEAYA